MVAGAMSGCAAGAAWGADAGEDAGEAAGAGAGAGAGAKSSAATVGGESAAPGGVLDATAVNVLPQAWQLVWPRKTSFAPQNWQVGPAAPCPIITATSNQQRLGTPRAPASMTSPMARRIAQSRWDGPAECALHARATGRRPEPIPKS